MNCWFSQSRVFRWEVKGEIELSTTRLFVSATYGVRCVFRGRQTSMFIWRLYQAQTKHLPYLLPRLSLFSSPSLFLPPYLFFWRGSVLLNIHSYQRQSRKAGRGAFEKCVSVCRACFREDVSLVSLLMWITMITWICGVWLRRYVS